MRFFILSYILISTSIYAGEFKLPFNKGIKCMNLAENLLVCKKLKKESQKELGIIRSNFKDGTYASNISISATVTADLASCEQNFIINCVKDMENYENSLNKLIKEVRKNHTDSIDLTNFFIAGKNICEKLKNYDQVSTFWTSDKFFKDCIIDIDHNNITFHEPALPITISDQQKSKANEIDQGTDVNMPSANPSAVSK
jgi:hypothetical protein